MQWNKRSNALVGLLLVLAASCAHAAKSDLIRLGDRDFTCAKGEVRINAESGSKPYPAGKREKLTFATKIGMLRYTCRGVRSVVSCPIGTSMVSVQRTFNPAKFKIECYGDPRDIPGFIAPGEAATGGGPATPGEAAGEGSGGAAGAE